MRIVPTGLPLVLPLLAAWAAEAHSGAERDSNHRVMVSFAHPASARPELELLDSKVDELQAMPGVLEVKGLRHLGMALAVLDSLDAEERFVQRLEEDPTVKVVSPDTLVHFHGTTPKLGNLRRSRNAPSSSGDQPGPAELRPLQNLRQCSAHSSCSALGLAGQCCPAVDGTMLSCCNKGKTANVVSFRSVYGKYIVVKDSGTVTVAGADVNASEKFQVFYNNGGTVSLRSHFGLYLSADEGGCVRADSKAIGDREKFQLSEDGDDLTASLMTGDGRYLVALRNDTLIAHSNTLGSREKFKMVSVGTESQHIPNEPEFASLWGLNEIEDRDIDAPEAWNRFTGELSPGIVVAVIDTGIDYTHEDLQENMWMNPGEIPGNGIDDDHNGFVDDVYGYDFANEDGDPMDDQMHGTHCAGTIGAVGNNGKGIVGVAWRGVRLMALKFMTDTGSGRTSDAVKALDYAVAHGARIVSNSWGSTNSNPALRVAIERAEAAGVLFVAAAGNTATNNDKHPSFPASYPVSSIIAVASTTRQGLLSPFSCFGEQMVDVAAPGSHIRSTVPGQKYQSLSGTSMATPYVSGLAALIWMYRPALSVQQVKEIIMSSAQQIPELEHKVATGLINAMSALQVASTSEPPYPPQHAPQAIAFEDTDPSVGLVAGTVTLTAAADESDVDYYKVYWVSRAGFLLDAVGNVTSTGARKLEVKLRGSVPLPQYAAGFVAVAGNATGEQSLLVGSAVPKVKVEDSGVPLEGPRSASWSGDVDLRRGVITGNLSVYRAMNERTISQYNVYWSNASGGCGPRVGSVPAVGFMWPECFGPSCSRIKVTNITGGLRFNRDAYGSSELAQITVTGPGSLRFTRFDTELYFDQIRVLRHVLNGQVPVPFEVELPVFPVTITWTSDESRSGSGWTFDLLQPEANAQLPLVGAAPRGFEGLRVVPAYGSTEFHDGAVFVEVVDYDRTMPPSPGFAPADVYFVDQDTAPGTVAGQAVLLPAVGAAASRDVAYYQLDFADTEGRAVARAGRANATGDGPVLIPIAVGTLPAEAAKLLARAGNSFGLAESGALVDLVDAVGGPTPNGTRAPSGQATARTEGWRGGASKSPWPQPSHSGPTVGDTALEPWLQGAVLSEEEARVVWQQKPSKLRESTLMQAQPEPHGRVLGAATVPGLDAKTFIVPDLHGAFATALAAALPGTAESDILITRVLAAPAANPPGTVESAAGAEVATVEFEVVSPSAASVMALDRIESRLIILSKGGSLAARFDQRLRQTLMAAGAKLLQGSHGSSVREPQRMYPVRRRQGRALAASAHGVAVQRTGHAALALEENVAPILSATLVAALVMLCGLGVALLAHLRRARK